MFVAGLVVCGLAPTMTVFLAGRFVHGLGAGLVSVGLYVLVAQAYPVVLRARVFAVLTTAWVLPALVGPVVAAQVEALVGWRWVFLGATAVAVGAWALVRSAPSGATGVSAPTRTRWAVAAAAGVLLVSAAGQRRIPGWWALVAVATALVVVAGLRLLPRGSWSGAPGLPSVIGARGLLGAAYLGAEVYVPLLLTLRRDLTLGEAGWALTLGAVTWSGGAWAAARLPALADEQRRVRLGLTLNAAGIAGFGLTLLTDVPVVVPILAWGVAGSGIGMAFATLSVLGLAAAPPGAEGQTSSALQLNDALVLALAMALGSAVFAGFATTAPVAGATLVVLAAAGVGVLALLPARRMAVPPA